MRVTRGGFGINVVGCEDMKKHNVRQAQVPIHAQNSIFFCVITG